MNYTIEDYLHTDKLIIIDNNLTSKLIFIPENFEDETDQSNYIYSETTADMKKLFVSNNINIDYITNNKPLLRLRQSADWFGPIILLSYTAYSQNPALVSISLSLISNYLYDIFKGNNKNKIAKFEIYVESKKKEIKKVKYEGNIDGIKALGEVIEKLQNYENK